MRNLFIYGGSLMKVLNPGKRKLRYGSFGCWINWVKQETKRCEAKNKREEKREIINSLGSHI